MSASTQIMDKRVRKKQQPQHDCKKEMNYNNNIVEQRVRKKDLNATRINKYPRKNNTKIHKNTHKHIMLHIASATLLAVRDRVNIGFVIGMTGQLFCHFCYVSFMGALRCVHSRAHTTANGRHIINSNGTVLIHLLSSVQLQIMCVCVCE